MLKKPANGENVHSSMTMVQLFEKRACVLCKPDHDLAMYILTVLCSHKDESLWQVSLDVCICVKSVLTFLCWVHLYGCGPC
jgi:hypothetical protein